MDRLNLLILHQDLLPHPLLLLPPVNGQPDYTWPSLCYISFVPCDTWIYFINNKIYTSNMKNNKWKQPIYIYPIMHVHWPTGISCSFANWKQLLIDQLKTAAHWPTQISCLLVNWDDLVRSLAYWLQMLIDQLLSASWNHVCFDRIYWSFWSCLSTY